MAAPKVKRKERRERQCGVRAVPQPPRLSPSHFFSCHALPRTQVRFLTKIFHPNVDKLGRICLDILKDKWSPALQIRTVLLSIQALMSAPNPDDPLDEAIARKWREDEAGALETAKEWTRLYATV
jgi:hypothetical protein